MPLPLIWSSGHSSSMNKKNRLRLQQTASIFLPQPTSREGDEDGILTPQDTLHKGIRDGPEISPTKPKGRTATASLRGLSMPKTQIGKPKERKHLSPNLATKVLTESGYRCAVPTCRNILALDMHHIWEVNAGGPDELWNLIALCPTCHALYHRGTIREESIGAWKSMLVSLGQAFDLEAIDKLLFLSLMPAEFLGVSGDGVLSFARLIAAGLTTVIRRSNNCWELMLYEVQLTPKGKMLIEAWKQGDREALQRVLVPGEPPVRPTIQSPTLRDSTTTV